MNRLASAWTQLRGSLAPAAALSGTQWASALRYSSDAAAPKVGALNHVAIAVPDVAKAAEKWRSVFGAEVSDPIDLPEHGVRVAFVQLANAKLELMQPLGDKSPIANFMQRSPRGGVHHICLEVDNVLTSLDHVASHVTALDKKPKIGAHGTPVAFLHPKDLNGVLIELEEVGAPGKPHGA